MDISELTDAQAVTAVLGGNRNAFSVLVARYHRVVQGMLYSHATGSQGVEDISQEAFIRAFQQLGALRNPETFGPWLLRIARNLAHDHGRQVKRLAAAAQVERGAVHDDPALRELCQILREEVCTLAPKYREVIMLHYFSDRTILDTARLLGISRAAANKRIQRARAQLGEKMARHLQIAYEPEGRAKEKAAVSAIMGAVFLLPSPARASSLAQVFGWSAYSGKAAALCTTLGICCIGLCGYLLAAQGEPPHVIKERDPVVEKSILPIPKSVTTAAAAGEIGSSMVTPLDITGIAGSVVDEEGKAIDGAEIAAFNTEDGIHKALSDKDGKFLLAGLSQQAYLLRINAYGFEPLKLSEIPTGVRGLQAVLKAALPIHGKVMREDTGVPIAGASVRFKEVEVLTGTAGEFDIDVAGMGPVNFSADGVTVHKAGYLATQALLSERASLPSPAARRPMPGESVRLMLKPFPTIQGTVVDDQGTPVAGAIVQFQGERKRADTDSKGHFKMDSFMQAPTHITIWPKQKKGNKALAPSIQDLPRFYDGEGNRLDAGNPVPATLDLNIVLHAPASLEGTITLNGALPASGASLNGSIGVTVGPHRFHTDSIDLQTGHFSSGDLVLPPGDAMLEVFVRLNQAPLGSQATTVQIPVTLEAGIVNQKLIDLDFISIKGTISAPEPITKGVVRYTATADDVVHSGTVNIEEGQTCIFYTLAGAHISGTVRTAPDNTNVWTYQEDFELTAPPTGEGELNLILGGN